jgi:hypothetical protein
MVNILNPEPYWRSRIFLLIFRAGSPEKSFAKIATPRLFFFDEVILRSFDVKTVKRINTLLRKPKRSD